MVFSILAMFGRKVCIMSEKIWTLQEDVVNLYDNMSSLPESAGLGAGNPIVQHVHVCNDTIHLMKQQGHQ